MSAGGHPNFSQSSTTLVSTTTAKRVFYGTIAIGVIAFLGLLLLVSGNFAFGAIVLGVFAAGLLLLVPRILANRRWLPAKVVVERYPFHLGDVVPIQFTQEARGSKQPVDQPVTVSVSLACVEQAQYSRGTDEVTVRETVAQVTARATGSIQAGTCVANAALHVPIDAGAPTFETNHNEIRWTLTVETSEPLSSFDKTFEVEVLPAVAPGLRQNTRSSIQDA